MLASFGLDGDPKLQRIAGAVHYLDAGGIPVPEAAGLESVLAGLRELHADDDALVARQPRCSTRCTRRHSDPGASP